MSTLVKPKPFAMPKSLDGYTLTGTIYECTGIFAEHKDYTFHEKYVGSHIVGENYENTYQYEIVDAEKGIAKVLIASIENKKESQSGMLKEDTWTFLSESVVQFEAHLLKGGEGTMKGLFILKKEIS